MKTKQEDKSNQIHIPGIKIGLTSVVVLGKSPMIMNRMSEKVRQELLLPARRKTAADKATILKHKPYEEFQSSIYKSRHPSALSAIHLPSGSFSKSMAQAAKDMQGTSKAQIQRLVRVKDLSVSIFGVPQIYCAVVRTADMNRTPDVRTRAIFPRWAAVFTVSYVSDFISIQDVGALLEAAGYLSGIGDHRGEKGGSFGEYGLSDPQDPDFLDLQENQGSLAQLQAMEPGAAEYYDDETEELLKWYDSELVAKHSNKLIHEAKNEAKAA